MHRFDGELRIVGISVGEIRITKIGPSPALMGKFAYMTDDQRSVGLYIGHSFSSQTQKLADALAESMERDMANSITLNSGRLSIEDSDSGEEWDDGDGDITFP